VGVFNYKDIYCEMKELIRHILREQTYPYGYWTEDRLREEAKKYKTTGEFQKKNTSAYTTARRKGKEFFEDITSHMVKKHIWTDKELEQEALKYDRQSDFTVNSKAAHSAAKRRGKDFYDKITSHMDKDYYKFWSDSDLEKEAKKYNTKTDFQKNSPSADNQARNRGKKFYDSITSHMLVKKRDWSDKELKQEAKKYQSRGDFQRYSGSAYVIARNKGKEFFNSISKHFLENLSTGETLISRILKKEDISFSQQYKFDDCTNTKKGRYCYKLPFDFYIPEYNSCIEYDGIQHFQPVKHFGGEERFIQRVALDKIKTRYCKKNGIKLIRIPYTMKTEEIEPYILKELGIK
jgi:hypothetical protein